MRLFSLERTGTSAHFWVGPVGLHLFRHKSKHQRGRLHFGWNWRGFIEDLEYGR